MLNEFINSQTELVKYYILNTSKNRSEIASELNISVNTLKRRLRKERTGELVVTEDNIRDILKDSGNDLTLLSRCMNTAPSNAKGVILEYICPPKLANKWWKEEKISIKEFVNRIDIPFITENTIKNTLYASPRYSINRGGQSAAKNLKSVQRTNMSVTEHVYETKPSLKSSSELRKETTLSKYGVNNVAEYEKFKEKAKKTNIKKYGYTYAMQSNSVKRKMINSQRESWHKTEYITSYAEYKKFINDSSFRDKIMEMVYLNIGEIPRNTIGQIIGVSETTAKRVMTNIDVPYTHKKSFKEQLSVQEYVENIVNSDITVGKARPEFMNGLELDIYVPDYKFAIEFNGSYWHSDKYKDRSYHQYKTTLARNNNVALMHIWEYDWNNPVKQDIIKSQIAYKLHSNKISHYYARKLDLKQVDKEEANQFYDTNHIQGRSNNSLNYGLYNGDELIACMGFNRKQFSKNEDNIYELIRFATKKYTSVAGGASRLFKHYLKENPDVVNIVSFANNDFAFDNDLSLYTKLGFIKESTTRVDRYKWVKYDDVVSRYKAKINSLKAGSVDGDTFRDNDTESSYMARNGYMRVYNSGTDKYVYNR
jgi:hypothetical protein